MHVHTCVCIRVHVSTCAPELPCSCSWMLHVQACWLGLPVPGRSTLWKGGRRGKRGEGQSYTYIFVLPTDFSCCVLSSVRVTPYMGSGPEHSPPSITTDKLTSQLGSRPMGAFTALLAHAHGNKHTSTRTQKCTLTHALSKCFPLSGPGFLVMEPSPNMGDRSLCLAR